MIIPDGTQEIMCFWGLNLNLDLIHTKHVSLIAEVFHLVFRSLFVEETLLELSASNSFVINSLQVYLWILNAILLV